MAAKHPAVLLLTLENFVNMIYIVIYTEEEVYTVDTAKVFINGRSQAVRLPKEYRFDGSDVFIKKIDDVVVLIPRDKVWKTFRNSFSKFSDDLLLERDNEIPQERDIL